MTCKVATALHLVTRNHKRPPSTPLPNRPTPNPLGFALALQCTREETTLPRPTLSSHDSRGTKVTILWTLQTTVSPVTDRTQRTVTRRNRQVTRPTGQQRHKTRRPRGSTRSCPFKRCSLVWWWCGDVYSESNLNSRNTPQHND